MVFFIIVSIKTFANLLKTQNYELLNLKIHVLQIHSTKAAILLLQF